MTMIEQFNGRPPSNAELSAAPIIERWLLITNSHGLNDASGFVTGHPRFSDGEFITTSPLAQIDPGSPPEWVRTKNSLYRLGRMAGAVEGQVRELSRDIGIRPQAWDILAYGSIIGSLSGQIEGQLDIVEQLIAVLLAQGHIKREAAVTLLKTYREERSQ